MIKFGDKVRAYRESIGVSQIDLAGRLGMTAAQLCRIESTGNPQIETAVRIAKALGVSLAELLPEEECLPNRRAKDLAPFFESIVSLSRGERKAILDQILSRERRFDRLEDRRHISHAVLLPLRCTYAGREKCGGLLARELREHLGVASAPFRDLAALLEFQHVRLHVAKLPKKVPSAAFWRRGEETLTVVVSADATPERRLYRMAYELGMAAVFLSRGMHPVEMDETIHKFATDFAVEFLLPAEGVVRMASTARVAPGEWTMKTLCRLKSFFGVSAELFLIRLEELGLIAPSVDSRLREEIKAYYKSHPHALEPKPNLPPSSYDMRLELLEGEEVVEVVEGAKETVK